MPPESPPLDLSALVAGRAPTEPERQVWATRTGIQLLILAVLLQWIPLIEYLGLMVGAIGVFYLIRGRRAFGLRHERLIWAAVLLFVATEVAAFGLDQEFGYALDVTQYTPSPEAETMAVAAFNGMAVGSSAVAVFLAVPYVLIGFDLEDHEGRWWLLAGLAAQIAVSVGLCAAVFLPMVRDSVPPAYATSPPDASILAVVDGEIRGLSILRLADAVPAALIAWAYWKAILRINRNEVPLAKPGGPSAGPS